MFDLCFFGGGGTWGLNTEQMLYHLNHATNPCFIYLSLIGLGFELMVSHLQSIGFTT
jgi:hypothetical protein